MKINLICLFIFIATMIIGCGESEDVHDGIIPSDWLVVVEKDKKQDIRQLQIKSRDGRTRLNLIHTSIKSSHRDLLSVDELLKVCKKTAMEKMGGSSILNKYESTSFLGYYYTARADNNPSIVELSLSDICQYYFLVDRTGLNNLVITLKGNTIDSADYEIAVQLIKKINSNWIYEKFSK
jgi:hypothetical protein